MAFYSGSMVNAAIDLFPEIGLDRSKFAQLPSMIIICVVICYIRLKMFVEGFWQEMGNRRKYLEDYAKEKGFNPLNPDPWYSVSLADFMSYKARDILFIFLFCYLLSPINRMPETCCTSIANNCNLPVFQKHLKKSSLKLFLMTLDFPRPQVILL